MNNQLAQMLIALIRHGSYEMKEEVLTSAGAQNLDTSGFKLSDLQDTEFCWENPQLELHAVFTAGIDTCFSRTVFNELEMGEEGSSKHLNVLGEEEDKDDAPPKSPKSERPTESTRLLRSCPFGSWIQNAPQTLYTTLFDISNSVRFCNVIYN